MDCSLPGSSIHGIFQARVPEWVAIAFSDTEAYHVSNTSYIAEKVHFGTQFTERGLEHSSDFSRWKAALTGKGMDYSLRFIPQFCVCARALSRVWFLAIPWTVAHQAPLSVGFPRQEYWTGLPFPPPVELLEAGIEPASSVPPVLAGGFFTTGTVWKALSCHHQHCHTLLNTALNLDLVFGFIVVCVLIYLNVSSSKAFRTTSS